MASLKLSGSFRHTEQFLKRTLKRNYMSILNKYGREGVIALSNATPVGSGLTASSWAYEIKESYRKGVTIVWTNSHIVDDIPVAILIQYGHGTRNGGYVQGRDYINPALQPIFDKLANEMWKEVIG